MTGPYGRLARFQSAINSKSTTDAKQLHLVARCVRKRVLLFTVVVMPGLNLRPRRAPHPYASAVIALIVSVVIAPRAHAQPGASDVKPATNEPEDSLLAAESPAGLEDRVRALEEMLQLMGTLEAPAGQPERPAPAPRTLGGSSGPGLDIAVALDTAAAWFSAEGLQTGAHDPADTGFHLQQVEISLGQNVDHLFELRAYLVFTQFGVELEEAFGRSLALPGGLQLRAGQFLTRIGRLNATHPHGWSFIDQAMVNGTFLGSEGSRGAGLEVSWLAPLPWYVNVIASATDAAGGASAISFFGGDDLGIETPADLLYTMAVRQFFDISDDVGLAWGVSTQQGPNSTGNGNRTEIYNTDLYLRWRPSNSPSRMSLSWTLEGMIRRRQVPGDIRVDTGGYTQLVWNINPYWEVGGRYGFVSGSPEDDLMPEATEDRHRVTTQITYRPSHFSRLRLQGNRDQPLYRDEPIWVGMLQAEFLVGSHGAHDY